MESGVRGGAWENPKHRRGRALTRDGRRAYPVRQVETRSRKRRLIDVGLCKRIRGAAMIHTTASSPVAPAFGGGRVPEQA